MSHFGILDLTFCIHHTYDETQVVHYKNARQSGVGERNFHKYHELCFSLQVNNHLNDSFAHTTTNQPMNQPLNQQIILMWHPLLWKAMPNSSQQQLEFLD